MREIILKVLSEIACGNAGNCQINLQAESAQIMIADRLVEQLEPHVRDTIENIVIGEDRGR